MPRPAAGTRALGIAVREQAVRDRLDIYQALDIDPHLLDYEGLALWEQARVTGLLDPSAVHIIAYIGHHHSVLVWGEGNDQQSVYHAKVKARQLRGAATGTDERSAADVAAFASKAHVLYVPGLRSGHPPPRNRRATGWYGYGAVPAPWKPRVFRPLNSGWRYRTQPVL